MPCFQEALAQPQPWWKIQLFVWEPVLFGTWDGVFTSCMINIFGVVLFLRTGWLVVSDELVTLEPLLGLGPGKLCHPWVFHRVLNRFLKHRCSRDRKQDQAHGVASIAF